MTAITTRAPAMPTILDIGRHIRALWDRHNALDEAALRGSREQQRAAERARDEIADERDAYVEVVMERTARTLGDTAVQVAHAFYMLDALTGSVIELEDARQLKRTLCQLQHVAASILPVIADAAGLDLATIGNGDLTECTGWHRLPAAMEPDRRAAP